MGAKATEAESVGGTEKRKELYYSIPSTVIQRHKQIRDMEGIACLLFNRIQEYDDVQCGGLIILKRIWFVNEKSDLLY